MAKHSHFIQLRGIRQNNLKGFDLDLPIGQLTVVTGLSGAGKSSLVFETLHAEGQRRYVETFSPYTRQFMELLDRPKVDSVQNIRPSIAIQQSNTVKTSRSTVGTITELCDYFKVWFAHHAALFDPATGELIEDDNPQSIWSKASAQYLDQACLIAFPIDKPKSLKWADILKSLKTQGYTRVLGAGGVERLETIKASSLKAVTTLWVVQDRLTLNAQNRSRFIEAAQQALAFGKGRLALLDPGGAVLQHFRNGLISPASGRSFRPASPALFSFNSPIGACPSCRGFGRIIEIDERLVIPDHSLSIDAGAIRAFQGEVYSESLRDLRRAAKRAKVRTGVPWSELSETERNFVWEGDPGHCEGDGSWYGVRRFFDWLQSKLYKMHVRVFLSKFRSYTRCPDCKGARLQAESLNWKWQGHTLPELYQKSVSELRELLKASEAERPPARGRGVSASRNGAASAETSLAPQDAALEGICTRLGFLEQVGLGYLCLDRSSRTLSGGETMRVNLTSCLGSSLVDTLFVLDEPSVGLHARDMDRLIGILRRLTDLGNTVVVVEHDEAIMRAADHLIEIGPKPGTQGGQLSFSGDFESILFSDTHTGRFLSGREGIPIPPRRKCGKGTPLLSIYGATKHNIKALDLHLPQRALVCLSGVSGSGKSTLLNNVIYQNLLSLKGQVSDDPAALREIESTLPLSEVVLVDQSPVSKTPRSNPAVFSGAWDEIRKLFAKLDGARSAGMQAGHFSFNSGDGRCETCSGLGYERIEMQFVSDLFVPCQSCEGRRFRAEVLEISFQNASVADILEMDIDRAVTFFGEFPKIVRCLQPMVEVGLGYLQLGQALNTLSGGESQRLKLVRYLSRVSHAQAVTKKHPSRLGSRSKKVPDVAAPHAIILIDEPTTGLHRADVKRLIGVLQSLVDAGNSVIVIEHTIDLLKVSDWIVELGPDAGEGGGRVVAQGTPEAIAKTKCETAVYLRAALSQAGPVESASRSKKARPSNKADRSAALQVAEPAASYAGKAAAPRVLSVLGAREHNLKNISVDIPHNQITVVTGVSGSGKSSLAFDIIFAEGQRRFMESMSAYARQFVEQMPRPEVDALRGIAPTVAIEQRVTKGTRKSTVATITEVAQYLRLLFARIGIQHSPTSDVPVVSQSPEALLRRLQELLKQNRSPRLFLCAQLIRGRKGHHQPLADWAKDHGHALLRIDGKLIPTEHFQKLDRYREHDIDVVLSDCGRSSKTNAKAVKGLLETALRLGKGTAYLLRPDGSVLSWLSTQRTDPTTGEAFPELDPKHFSWNSPRGWCPTCRGYGQLYDWMAEQDEAPEGLPETIEEGAPCPDCAGARLNALSRAVKLPTQDGKSWSMPELLALVPSDLVATIRSIKTDARSRPVVQELLPEITERLQFMGRVGLDYLSLDRATATLSGGEAQRIRLAAQLGSNLAGVLYVLDEPSIGLHARDNEKLIASLELLRDRGNTLLIVEHDTDTMRHADTIIDLGPAAGIHGGAIIARGSLQDLSANADSITGRYLRRAMVHPLRGSYRPLPMAWSPRRKKASESWITLQGAKLRNLKGFDVSLPKQRLSVVCGVSGAGKSTLIRDLLKPLVEAAISSRNDALRPKNAPPGLPRAAFRSLQGGADLRKVIEVDQSPIGKTPRSTPATYIGAFDTIRDIFAQLPEARFRGYGAGTFSFNTKGGRCEACKGAGRVKLEMNFMPDTYVRCEECDGRRYGAELNELRWNGKSIADVLTMSFEEAADFFSFHSGLKSLLEMMLETGLGYLTLGQNSPSLSGGEAQRLKLVSELAKGMPSLQERNHGLGQGNLYLLEEPTIGLHLSDCERLIELLHRLVDKGHTVVVIEHHLDLIAEADYLIEIGPDGGDSGGELLYQGAVNGLHAEPQSVTKRFLENSGEPSEKMKTADRSE